MHSHLATLCILARAFAKPMRCMLAGPCWCSASHIERSPSTALAIELVVRPHRTPLSLLVQCIVRRQHRTPPVPLGIILYWHTAASDCRSAEGCFQTPKRCLLLCIIPPGTTDREDTYARACANPRCTASHSVDMLSNPGLSRAPSNKSPCDSFLFCLCSSSTAAAPAPHLSANKSCHTGPD